MDELDEKTRASLSRFGFDQSIFDKLRTALRTSGADAFTGRLDGSIEAPAAGDLTKLPEMGSPEGQALDRAGREALAAGEVGVVILAGGMATRFGGVVKAVVEVVPGYSFLQLKLADVERAAAAVSGRIPVYLMASHATSDVLRAKVKQPGSARVPVEIVDQSVTLRLTPSGEIFRDGNGQPSPCASGHGDLLETLRRSGALARFRRQGGRMLLVSNVDNLAATVDARVIGAHRHGHKAVTVDVVAKEPGDRGGIPARVGGHLQIVEEFRLPSGFDGDRVPYFNTNTFVFDAEAIDRDFALDWFLVRRKVDGQDVVQPERLLGQVTAVLPTQFLIVPRHGRGGRFLPVKDREELAKRMPEIRLLLQDLGVSVAAVA